MNWKISDVEERILMYYMSAHNASTVRGVNAEHTPILLTGQSGIGKTETVKSAARLIADTMGYKYLDYSQYSKLSPSQKAEWFENLGPGGTPFVFVDLNLLTHDPIDFSGRPSEGMQTIKQGEDYFAAETTEFVPMGWASMLRYYPGMVFIDEVTNVSRNDLRAVALKLVGERKTGYCQLSDDVLIVMAGNKPEHSSLAMNLPVPLINRTKIINTTMATAEDWFDYAKQRYGDFLNYPVAGYLSILAAQSINPNEDCMEGFPSPRSCEKLLIMVQDLGQAVKSGIMDGAQLKTFIKDSESLIGPTEGAAFEAWYSNNELIDELFRSTDANFIASKIKGMKPSEVCGLATLVGRNLATQSFLKHDSYKYIVEGIIHAGKDYGHIMFVAADIFSRHTTTVDDVRTSLMRLQYLKDLVNKSAQKQSFYDSYATLPIDKVFDFLCNVTPEESPTFVINGVTYEHPFSKAGKSPAVKDMVSIAAVMAAKKSVSIVVEEIKNDKKLIKKVNHG